MTGKGAWAALGTRSVAIGQRSLRTTERLPPTPVGVSGLRTTRSRWLLGLGSCPSRPGDSESRNAYRDWRKPLGCSERPLTDCHRSGSEGSPCSGFRMTALNGHWAGDPNRAGANGAPQDRTSPGLLSAGPAAAAVCPGRMGCRLLTTKSDDWRASRKHAVEMRQMVGTRGAGRKWAPDIRPGLPATRRGIT